MKALLRLSRGIDALNRFVGQSVYWLILVAVLLSAGNAIVRKAFNYSSNAYLETQWYLFSAVFLLCAGYTLLRNEHVRIDVVAGRFSRRTQTWIDIFGTVFFLLPMAIVFIYLSWPVFVRTWVHEEISGSAGGLAIWPARAAGAHRLLPARAPGRLRTDQAHRLPARHGARPRRHDARPFRGTGTRRGDPPDRRGQVLMELLAHNLAPIMFAALVVFLLLGYPVAFALAANGIFFGLVGIELGLLRPELFQALPERVWGIMSNDTLLAVPFFTFMGLVLERSGMAEDLLDTIGQVFGSLRGGLAFAVIFVGALLAATTGVVAASVISMGLISLPIMLRYGYDRRFATGVIAASGTLAQIIPPSIVLIIMADQLGRSVGDMYAGAIIPGLVLTGLYATYAHRRGGAEAVLGARASGGGAHAQGGRRIRRLRLAHRRHGDLDRGRHRIRPLLLPAAVPRGPPRRAARARRRRGRHLRLRAGARQPDASRSGSCRGSRSRWCSC